MCVSLDLDFTPLRLFRRSRLAPSVAFGARTTALLRNMPKDSAVEDLTLQVNSRWPGYDEHDLLRIAMTEQGSEFSGDSAGAE